MRSILLCSRSVDQDELTTELWEHGSLGIVEEPGKVRAFFDEAADFALLTERFAEILIETRSETPTNPADFPKQGWEPIEIGRRFWIAPSWVEGAAPPDRFRLAIDNPNAFGSGRHESTQLVLEALETHEASSSLATVLDIGCGSGILSQAAWLLGARSVFSCDIQHDAIESSKSELRHSLFQGSADALRTHSGDTVIANISATVIDVLAWELSRVTKPSGILILAGFVGDRPPLHFTPERVTQRGEWLCWICRPQQLSPEATPLASHVHQLQWW